MSRTASIKNAASRENKDMKDAIAYSGTMSMIRITCLPRVLLLLYRPDEGSYIPLEMRLSVVLEMHGDGHRRDERRDRGACSGHKQNG